MQSHFCNNYKSIAEIKSKNKKRKARADDEEDCNKLSKVSENNFYIY